MELLPEEAYYWTYWQHPAWSYFDHPPMVAWIIGLGTAVFGNSEFGVRVGTLVLALGSTVLLFALGRIWYDRRVGWWAVLLFNLLPIFTGTGLWAFPDGPLIFFWLLTLYAASQAIHPDQAQPHLLAGKPVERRRQGLYWMLAGLAFGAALLAKYTAIILAPSLLLFLFFARTYRPWLRRPEPWLAVGLALVVFSPVIWWNAHHDWASFRFQTSRTDGGGDGAVLNATKFWLLQVAVLTPMLFGLCVVAACRAVKRGWFQRDDRWSFVAAFFFPLFLVFVRASFKTEVHINWTAPAYLSLILAAAAVFAEGLAADRPPVARRWRVGGVLTVTLCAAFLALGITTLVWGVPAALAYRQASGWRAIGHEVHEIEEALERVTGQRVITIGVDKYNLAAQLGFYMREPEDSVNAYVFGKEGLGYPYWTDMRRLEGLPAVVVFKRLNDDAYTILRNNFVRTDEPQRIEVAAGGKRKRVVYVVTGYGFRSAAREHVQGNGQPVDDDDRPQPAR